jgi:protein SCO1/2
MPNDDGLSRRSFLQALAVPAPPIRGHGKINPPVAVPNIALVRDDGASTRLLSLVTGHATAVQLMFTACTTTCPIQAAIFARVETKLADIAARRIQLLSLSVDPQDDTPKALSSWRHRFHAGPYWIAAAPKLADLSSMQEFFGKGGDLADHSTQVHILDRQGRLVWRTFEMPTAEEIIGVLQKI